MMSNSSSTSERAMWRESAAWPFSGGIWRGPRPSSAIAVLVAHAEREGRVVVEEEAGGVVVEAEEEHVGLLLREPASPPRS